jgi:hypothetical protein
MAAGGLAACMPLLLAAWLLPYPACKLHRGHGHPSAAPHHPALRGAVRWSCSSSGGEVAAAAPGSAPPRSTLRPRKPVSYALPSLLSKLRRGDPFTFGPVEEAAAATTADRTPAAVANGSRSEGGSGKGRARTKPRGP